jgi:hypothetical protein
MCTIVCVASKRCLCWQICYYIVIIIICEYYWYQHGGRKKNRSYTLMYLYLEVITWAKESRLWVQFWNATCFSGILFIVSASCLNVCVPYICVYEMLLPCRLPFYPRSAITSLHMALTFILDNVIWIEPKQLPLLLHSGTRQIVVSTNVWNSFKKCRLLLMLLSNLNLGMLDCQLCLVYGQLLKNSISIRHYNSWNRVSTKLMIVPKRW